MPATITSAVVAACTILAISALPGARDAQEEVYYVSTDEYASLLQHSARVEVSYHPSGGKPSPVLAAKLPADTTNRGMMVVFAFFVLAAIPGLAVCAVELTGSERDPLFAADEGTIPVVVWGADTSSQDCKPASLQRDWKFVITELALAVFLGTLINWSPVVPLPLIVKGPIVAVVLLSYLWGLWYCGVFSSTLRSQGLRKPRFLSRSFIQPSLFSVFMALPVVGVIGWHIHGLMPFVNLHLVMCAAVYPLWGVFQQWLVQGFVTLNLVSLFLSLGQRSSMSARNRLARMAVAVFISAVCFALCHYPDPTMMKGTFPLGVCWAAFFIRDRDAFALGAWHGVIGACFFFWVVGNDPLAHMLCMLKAPSFNAERSC